MGQWGIGIGFGLKLLPVSSRKGEKHFSEELKGDDKKIMSACLARQSLLWERGRSVARCMNQVGCGLNPEPLRCHKARADGKLTPPVLQNHWPLAAWRQQLGAGKR